MTDQPQRPRPLDPPDELAVLIVPALVMPPSCHITWGELEYVWPVATVRARAQDMFTAAARAESEATWHRVLSPALEERTLAALLGEVRSTYPTQVLGERGVLTFVAGVSLFDRAPFVHVNADPYPPTRMSPDELRAMAAQWTQTAEAAEHDAVLDYAMAEAGIGPDQRQAVFAAARIVRSDKT